MTETSIDRSAWSDDQWADYINAPEANPVLAIIERGRRLKERRDACDQKGDRSNTFEAFCKAYLKMSRETAHRYIQVADWCLSCDTRITTLPHRFGALLELTRFSPEDLRYVIDVGWLTPEMTRKEIGVIRCAVTGAFVDGLPPEYAEYAYIFENSKEPIPLQRSVDPPVTPYACSSAGEELSSECCGDICADDAISAPTPPLTNPVVVNHAVPAAESGVKEKEQQTSQGLCNMLFLVLCDLEDGSDVDVNDLRDRLAMLKPDTLNKLIEILLKLRG